MTPDWLRVVIPSRGRAATMTTDRLLPYATLVVPESETEAYAARRLETIPLPDDRVGLAKTRNWILRRFPEQVIVMVDDDVSSVSAIAGARRYILSRSEIAALLTTVAQVAVDLDVSLFGLNQVGHDVRKYHAQTPFRLNAAVGGLVGVVGRSITWDENLTTKVDVDATLQALLTGRIVWLDHRFGFAQQRYNNAGGNAPYRTADVVARERAYLERKWGRWISFESQWKGTDSCKPRVPRSQVKSH